MNSPRWLLATLLASPVVLTTQAATVVKCIDQNGNVTYTQTSCPPQQTLDKVMKIQNDRPSGDGPSVPLAVPPPPPPPQPEQQTEQAPSPQDAPPPEEYDDGDDSGSRFDSYDNGYDGDYIPAPRPHPPYPNRPYPPYPPYHPYPPQPPFPPHPQPPIQPPVQPQPAPKGVGAPKNATKHTGPQRGQDQDD